MNRIFILILLLFISDLSFSQIIKKFATEINLNRVVTFPQHFEDDEVISNVVKFYYTHEKIQDNDTSLILDIYNLDNGLYRSVNIPHEFKYMYVKFVSTNFFNNDDKIEFVFIGSNDHFTYHSISYTEDLDVLYDFGNENAESFFTTADDVSYIITFTYKPGGGYIPDIDKKNYYLIDRSTTKNSSVGIKSIKKFPYPNPAAQTINLPYQLNSGEQADMQIYDVNGKLVATKRIDAAFDKIVLNVSGYEKGMYVYSYNGKSAKFVVE